MIAALLTLALAPQRVAVLDNPLLDEISGLVASRRYPGVFWAHNDSGDSARLFAVRADGTTVVPAWMDRRQDAGVASGRKPFEGLEVKGASNLDWEDIASDGDTLYVADTGNNANARRDLCVYAVPEPNPAETAATRALREIWIAYADQTEFPPKGEKRWDCEAVFVHRGALWFLTKHRTAQGLPLDSTALYRLPLARASSGVVHRLSPIDRREGLGGWVTGADASPSGRTLAVLTHLPKARVWLFDLRGVGDRLLSKPIRVLELGEVGQIESVAFDGEDRLLLANESRRELFRLDLSPGG